MPQEGGERQTDRQRTDKQRETGRGLDLRLPPARASRGGRAQGGVEVPLASFPPRTGPLAGGLSGDSASLRGGSKPTGPRRLDVRGTDSGSPGSGQEGAVPTGVPTRPHARPGPGLHRAGLGPGRRSRPGGGAQSRLPGAPSEPTAAATSAAQPRRRRTGATWLG